MSLKLFRHTGFHSILVPGETRVAMHPGWAIAFVAAWVALACNAWLWRALAHGAADLPGAVAAGLAYGGAAGAVLSALGWRRTLRAAGTVLLLVAALAAGGVWTQAIPLEVAQQGQPVRALLPSWASLLRWQVPLVLLLLGVAPALWLWTVQMRRMPGTRQLKMVLAGLALSLAATVAGFGLLQRLAA